MVGKFDHFDAYGGDKGRGSKEEDSAETTDRIDRVVEETAYEEHVEQLSNELVGELFPKNSEADIYSLLVAYNSGSSVIGQSTTRTAAMEKKLAASDEVIIDLAELRARAEREL